MIELHDIVAIGKFHKTHALKGELNVVLDIDTDFIDNDTPLIIDVDGIFTPFYPDSVRPKGEQSSLVKLHGIDSGEEARSFVNKTIYALRSDLKRFEEECGEDADNDDEGGYADDFIGYAVENRQPDGTLVPLGRITDLNTQTQNALFIIETPQGDTLYIPVADEFILGADEETHTLTMSLPEGLTVLNT